MLRDGGSSGYREVLTTGPAVRPFAAAVVARLPISMAPLDTLLLVQHGHGSYGFAGHGFAIAPTLIIQQHLVDALAGRRYASVGQPR